MTNTDYIRQQLQEQLDASGADMTLRKYALYAQISDPMFNSWVLKFGFGIEGVGQWGEGAEEEDLTLVSDWIDTLPN